MYAIRSYYVLIQCNEIITEEHLVTLRARSVEYLDLLHMEGSDVSPSFRNTLLMDKVEDSEAAILEIYRKLRPSNPPTPEVAAEFFNNLFFSPEQYDLSEVGRLKINQQLGTEELPLSHVITSYSIHYTKLYDHSRRSSSQPPAIPWTRR